MQSKETCLEGHTLTSLTQYPFVLIWHLHVNFFSYIFFSSISIWKMITFQIAGTVRNHALVWMLVDSLGEFVYCMMLKKLGLGNHRVDRLLSNSRSRRKQE